MNMTDKDRDRIIKGVAIAILLFFLWLLAGCRTRVVHVPVESVKTEYKDRISRDSVLMYDSVFMMIKGDTVWKEKYKYLYRDKLIRDSVFRTDSIAVPYPVEITREVKVYPRWLIILACLGGLLIGYAGFRLYKFLKI